PLARQSLGKMWPQFADSDGGPVFDKTFQAMVPVSPPVLSDWREFLLNGLAEAFASHRPTADFEAIYRLYRLRGSPHEQSANPREIKLFINRLVLLHREWGHAIPLPVVALFVLRQSDIDASREVLTVPGFLTREDEEILQETRWAEYFAAMHFNVDVENALQVLISSPLEQALVSGDVAELDRLSEIRGFSAVCQQVVDDKVANWGIDHGVSLIHAAFGLATISPRANVATALAQVLHASLSIPHWALDDDVAEKVVAVMGIMGDTVERRTLFREFLSRAVPTFNQAPDELVAARPWARGYLRLLTIAPTVLDEATLRAIGVPGEANQYVAFMATIVGDPHAEATRFSQSRSCGELTAEIRRSTSSPSAPMGPSSIGKHLPLNVAGMLRRRGSRI
ncbi:MAG TPA: hypothetical protein VN959_21290, partial [Mycobacterium sp.]|nr:hypothetical protein [Mycobacterium sp.]